MCRDHHNSSRGNSREYTHNNPFPIAQSEANRYWHPVCYACPDRDSDRGCHLLPGVFRAYRLSAR